MSASLIEAATIAGEERGERREERGERRETLTTND
jgi:hypothetical protein